VEEGKVKGLEGTRTDRRERLGKEGVSQRSKRNARETKEYQGIDRNSKSTGLVSTSAQIL